jgi:hypothetical protein
MRHQIGYASVGSLGQTDVKFFFTFRLSPTELAAPLESIA